MRNGHATSNYRAVAGPYTEPYVGWPPIDEGGVFYRTATSSSPTSRRDEQTAGHRRVQVRSQRPDRPKYAAIWAGMTGWYPSLGGSVRYSDSFWPIDNATAVINGSASQAFSSRHPGGVNVGFCDGSVRFFKNSADPNTIRFLAGRNDGMVVNPDF